MNSVQIKGVIASEIKADKADGQSLCAFYTALKTHGNTGELTAVPTVCMGGVAQALWKVCKEGTLVILEGYLAPDKSPDAGNPPRLVLVVEKFEALDDIKLPQPQKEEPKEPEKEELNQEQPKQQEQQQPKKTKGMICTITPTETKWRESSYEA